MNTVFVIQNQHGHYLSKQKDWTDGKDRRQLFRTAHHDEAVNQVFELSSKDISLRANALSCELDDSGHPQVKPGPALAAASDEHALLEREENPSET